MLLVEKKPILFASIPFSAFVFFIFYRKSGYNYAEHLVANLFLTAFFNLVMTLLIPLQVMINKFSTFLLYTIPLLLFQLIYFAVAYQGLLGKKNTSAFKVYFVSLVNILCWSLLTSALISTYILFF